MRTVTGLRMLPALAVGAGLIVAAGPVQAAGLDSAFGVDGKALTPLSATFSDRYLATVAAPGGGTYNVGYTSVTANDRAFVLTHTDASGKLQPGFGAGGVAVVNVSPAPFPAAPNAPSGAAQAGPAGAGEVARGVVVQSDGKIVISGQAETPAASGKPDSRDIDIYAARFTASGVLDASFGVNGVRRIDLSDGMTVPSGGSATTTSVRADQGYGLSIRPDDKLLITGAKGSDSSDNVARPDQDLAVVQLMRDGAIDTGYGTGGVATGRTPNINENPRQGLVEADGKFITTAYGNPTGSPTRPILYRFNANGTPDATFGTNGIGTGSVGGAAGRAEVYGIVAQGSRYVLAGYGSRNETPTDTDLVVYRFNGDGTWDQSFGRDGLVTYVGNGTGGADRARNITALPDGRIVTVGGTEVSATPTAVDALVFVLKSDGTPDTTISPDGGVTFDLGGPGDFFYGVTTIGNRVVAAGYLGGASAAADEAALGAVDVTPPVPATTTSPAPPAPAAEPAPVPGTAPKPKARTAGKVAVSCVRIGKRRDRIRCTVTQANVAIGNVAITLKRKGAKALKGKAKTKKGKATITIKASRKRAKYTVALTLPTPAGTVQKITRTVTVR
jgi:uncharacterized delta-60 repeat protein